MTSIFALGGLCGALAAQPLGNRFGRRSTLALNSLGFIVAGVMKALATSVPVLTFGRFVSGLSSGVAAVVVPLYVNEIAPPDAKGKLYRPPRPRLRWWSLGLTGWQWGLHADFRQHWHPHHAASRPIPQCVYPSTLAATAAATAAQSLTHRAGKPQYWRLILLVGAAVGALQGALVLAIPESPKYLVSVGNRSGARDSLARLRGVGGASIIEDEIRGN